MIGTLPRVSSALPPITIFQYIHYDSSLLYLISILHFFFLFYLFVYLLIFVKGDRFIPNRSLMDLDQAHSLLTNRTRKIQNKEFNVFSVFIP